MCVGCGNWGLCLQVSYELCLVTEFVFVIYLYISSGMGTARLLPSFTLWIMKGDIKGQN